MIREPLKLASFVNQLLKDGNGIATVSIVELKREFGVDRFGKNIVSEIENVFEQNNIGFYPTDFADRDNVRLYKEGTVAAAVINAATTVDDVCDRYLRQFNEGDATAQTALQKIRVILDELYKVDGR